MTKTLAEVSQVIESKKILKKIFRLLRKLKMTRKESQNDNVPLVITKA